MNRGYVHLWRKSLDAGWIKNHKLWALWTWCLMKATHREFDAIVGSQTVHLLPGQFVTGLRVIAEETGLTIQETRTALAFLKNAGNLTIKTTNKYSIITIVNWPTYQPVESENNTQNNKPLTNEQQHTITEEHKHRNKGDFFDISQEISALVNQLFPTEKDKALFQSVKEAFASTRKGKKISASVILKQLKQWEKFPLQQIHNGIHTYLDKQCHMQGKNEKYLLGIIRNSNGTGPTPEGRTMNSTGSRLLDQHYRQEGYTIL